MMDKAKRIVKVVLCLMLVLVCATPVCMPSAEAVSVTKILRVNADNVRLHYTATGGGASSMILNLDKGTKVMYLGMKNKVWAEVVLSNGLVGYVYKDYLSEYGAVNSRDVYKVSTAKLPTYKVSGKTMKKTGSTLAKNSIVFVRDTKGGYAKVLTLKGKWTYVKTSGLKRFSK